MSIPRQQLAHAVPIFPYNITAGEHGVQANSKAKKAWGPPDYQESVQNMPQNLL